MKKLIALLFITGSVAASDLYVDAYRFADTSHTGKVGLAVGDYNAELSVSDGTFAFGERKYLTFTNIEIGAQFMLTNKVNSEALDSRVIDVEGGWHVTVNPYFKAGSDLFVMAKLDESNKAVIQVGFKLF